MYNNKLNLTWMIHMKTGIVDVKDCDSACQAEILEVTLWVKSWKNLTELKSTLGI